MVVFREITDNCSHRRSTYKIYLDSIPVIDYKLLKLKTLSLIPGDFNEIDQTDIVTVGELKTYIVKIRIPYEHINIREEFTEQFIKKFEWTENTLELFTK